MLIIVRFFKSIDGRFTRSPSQIHSFFAVTQLLLISPIFLIVWSELLKVKCKYGCKLFYVGFVLVNSVAELLHNV